jgi:L,D-peptidoglycan transpeptidase YkuD (ErfK/YbiS/YcfS/YnhG family)
MHVKRISESMIASKFTRSVKFRQKLGILQPRGPVLHARVGVRPLPHLPGQPWRAVLRMGPHQLPCAIGWSGIAPKRREGDGVTPLGTFFIADWRRRPDAWKIFRPDSRAIRRTDGWCDDPRDSFYNRAVTLPFRARAETLWRDDGVYDLVGVLDFNRRPRILGRGSAIFLHIAHSDDRPTAGCIALARADLQKLQILWRRPLQIDIGAVSTPRRWPKIAEPTRT